MSNTVRVWDLPTRVFHWALVACVTGLVTTAQLGGNAMVWHFRCGYTVLSLLLFRMVWGLLGGHWSRFSSFLYSPATVLRYLKGQSAPEHSIGHNPLGSFSVFALLGFLLLQVASGLISDDEIAAAGPLVKFVPNSWVSNATHYHANIGKLILLGLLVLHIGAILFYRFKKGEDLVAPMIRGDKQISIAVDSSRDDGRSRLLAAAIFLGCAALVAWTLGQTGS
ncbi:MAG: cytochrome b/b6 domain-containing protein [Rhodoferax sp.]|uniref:cytochrome b/b6 domain-containing protein n=1 Tax=Rhodoferax sp. TaxID=50421 RepID=UPI002638D6B9|nr:cytochrome b/b6 domain-containing protein [Rhodoferax sp.]MDD5334356.1 cytochrome b/b6 domain-containing protein [Rhodoferax sp.]